MLFPSYSYKNNCIYKYLIHDNPTINNFQLKTYIVSLHITASILYMDYIQYTSVLKKRKPFLSTDKNGLFGSPCWTRTNDPAVNSRMLYRLS